MQVSCFCSDCRGRTLRGLIKWTQRPHVSSRHGRRQFQVHVLREAQADSFTTKPLPISDFRDRTPRECDMLALGKWDVREEWRTDYRMNWERCQSTSLDKLKSCIKSNGEVPFIKSSYWLQKSVLDYYIRILSHSSRNYRTPNILRHSQSSCDQEGFSLFGRQPRSLKKIWVMVTLPCFCEEGSKVRRERVIERLQKKVPQRAPIWSLI